MHENTCIRRNTLCEKCGQLIEKSLLSKHFEEFHTLVTCDCGTQAEKQFLILHQTRECSLRKVTCAYCSFQTKQLYLLEHQIPCGEKTELCPKCNLYIKRKGNCKTKN